ncbi:MAG: pyrimidine dimer DNA glycosylase [Candidatus Aminicenantes bacterium]|nr:MAG: pyrimidine dimer DNA glycosylase [Candidatus Aminicenantes bacterium]
MRIWDIPAKGLCRNHLLGEHRELHAIWSILTTGKKGYAFHPETQRWKGRLRALYLRHQDLVQEMNQRGYKHQSPLDVRLATGEAGQTEFVDSPEIQRKILGKKKCGCRV